MTIKIGRLAKITIAGALAIGTCLGMSVDAAAQDAPADSQQAAQNDSAAARISFIQGDVSTQHDGSTDWAAATLNTPVVLGDHVSTGPNAKAEIQLDYANILRMSDQTTANVVTLNRNQIQLQIGQGLATYDVLKNGQANVEIDTPNVAVRPAMGEGSYRILVNSDGETIVDVRKGSAEISTPQGSTHVERDQRITIQGSGDKAQYQISGAPGRDDWDRWNADRDRSIEGAQSWHNTNPYYTGTQDLDSYGHWGNVPDYGPVWFPSSGPDWVPYRDGRWVYEPYYGWTWVSYEPWGWAPYHYGRWFVYGGNWGWWPGPVNAGYYPVWAPAYVSFFGFGGGGWSLGFGFGGGFGSVGWLPCGPGDRFFPWYGRGITRVSEVNIYNIHNHTEGFDPLHHGPRAYSNVDLASRDQRVRAGISSMQSSQFGRERVPERQSRIDASTLGQAHVMTGANPVSPSRESYQPSSRAVNPRSIPSRPPSTQHFFSGKANGAAQAGAGNLNRGGSFPANSMKSNPRSLGPENSANMNRGPGATGSRQPIQSSRPGWHPFTPPSGASQAGRTMPSTNGGTLENQRAPQQSRPSFTPPSQQPRPYQGTNNSRGGSNGYRSSRPTLDMHQPIVTPRGGGSPPSRGPSGGNYSAPQAPRNYGGGGSRPAPSSPAPRGGFSGGGSRGGNSGGASRGGSSGGGHSNNHR
jgi:uncharacterized protein DUF6600/FecR-like protein